MADSTALVEQREAFAAKQKDLAEVLEAAGRELDFSRKTVLDKLGATDTAHAVQKFKDWNREAETMGQDLSRTELKLNAARVQEREEERRQPADRIEQPGYNEQGGRKSWSQQYVESKAYKAAKDSRGHVTLPFDIDIGMKTLFETGAGFAIESVRSGLLVEKATRPIQVTDLIPSFPISQAAFVYMEETTRTHNAAERAEGTAYPESAFVWTQKSSAVQKIADSIPVTDEQLEDEQQVRSILDQRLAFGVRQRLDQQVLTGNGTPPNLRGINAVVGVQTLAKGSDPTIVAFMKALTLIRFTGRAQPSGAVMHPNDWQDVLLTQNANGDFLFGNPFMGTGPQSLFGVPVAISDAQTENTAIIADFANFTRLDDRRGVQVQTGWVASQFTEGKITIRADMRAAFTVTRPAAVVLLSGI